MKEKRTLKITKIIFPILLLTALDQLVKIYIFNNLMLKEFDIIGNFIGFKPVINDKYSWINSVGNLGIGLSAHITFNIGLLIAAILAYDFIRSCYSANKLIHNSFAFLLAGALCSLIDKIAWGGSLDFILLKGFFIFDLKDVYLTLFYLLIILSVIVNYKKFKNLKSLSLLKEFYLFIKHKYLKSQ